MQRETDTPTDTDTSTDTDTPTGPETSAPGPVDLPRLRTEDNWIVTADGERYTPRGVNLVDPTYAEVRSTSRGGDFWDSLELATDRSQAWYPTMVRINVEPDRVDHAGKMQYAERWIDEAVEFCRQRGVYVQLCYALNADWGDQDNVDRVNDFWDTYAPRYADDTHVLYNFWAEPIAPNGNTLENWKAWRETAQPIVDRIRADAPETPIVVGSPSRTSIPKWAPAAPFEGDNLVYNGHIYPGDAGYPHAVSNLEREYGAPADDVPVIISEWGYIGIDEFQPSTTSEFGELFRDWIERRDNLGWLVWSFGAHWQPTMLDLDHEVAGGEMYEGAFVKEWLSDRRTDQVPDVVPTDGAEFEEPADSTPPERPANPAVESGPDGNPVLSWDQSADEERRVAHYSIFVDGDHHDYVDSYTLLDRKRGEVENLWDRTDLRFEWTLQEVDAESDHDVSLTAVDSLSNESPDSDVVTYEGSG